MIYSENEHWKNPSQRKVIICFFSISPKENEYHSMILPSINFIYFITGRLTASSKIIEYELNEWRKKSEFMEV